MIAFVIAAAAVAVIGAIAGALCQMLPLNDFELKVKLGYVAATATGIAVQVYGGLTILPFWGAALIALLASMALVAVSRFVANGFGSKG